jgi:hypothetical protein
MLNSWQNQPGKTDQTDHKLVHEGNLMASTNKKDGNECLLTITLPAPTKCLSLKFCNACEPPASHCGKGAV